jgi:hypothetical protein
MKRFYLVRLGDGTYDWRYHPDNGERPSVVESNWFISMKAAQDECRLRNLAAAEAARRTSRAAIQNELGL